MDFHILGPLEVRHQDRRFEIAGSRQRELLAILLLHAREVMSTDRLMDALWGEQQPTAGSAALRVRVSQLRRALGPDGDLLITRAPGYALMIEPDALDLRRFETLFDGGARAMAAGDAAAAAEQARAALALWRGAPLADFAYASFAQAAIARLEEMRAAALELRIDAELALGLHGRVVPELQELVLEHPLRERLWALLMLALYRAGRQADALAAYRSARSRLVEEIGIDPGPELQALEAQVLAQDPALGVASAAAHAPQRAVLVLTDGEGAVPVLAERLAARAGQELLALALVDGGKDLAAAAARLGALRDGARARGVAARVAAFTTTDAGADAVRMAAEQDAAILIAEAPADGRLGPALQAVLAGAVCDVALVAGADPAAAPADGPVLVPFAGHENDWSAAEIGGWLAGGGPMRLLGARRVRGRDASRLLANASLALQRAVGIAAEPVLLEPGADSVVAAAAGASAVVVGLSERWARDGIGATRLHLARDAPCPVLLVRGGLRPGGLAPPHALTRFTWSGGG